MSELLQHRGHCFAVLNDPANAYHGRIVRIRRMQRGLVREGRGPLLERIVASVSFGNISFCVLGDELRPLPLGGAA